MSRTTTALGLAAVFALGLLAGRHLDLRGRPSGTKPEPAVAVPAPPAPPADLAPIPAAPAPETPAETVLLPEPREAAEILELLRTVRVEAPGLALEGATVDTLPALFERARGALRLSATATQGPAPGGKSLLELLPGSIGYWRPRTLEPAEALRLVREWPLWRSAKPAGIVIDLRYTADPNNFAGAVPTAGLFMAPGRPLYSVQGLNQPQQLYRSERQPLDLPAWMPLIVLTNRQTRGAGEALAWSLRTGAGAILVGRPTAGEGGPFREVRLKSGRFLRVATARAMAADGTDLLGTGLEPDVAVEGDPALERRAFLAAYASGAASTLAEPAALPRLNQDINPVVLDSTVGGGDAPLADPVLKAGVDAVLAIQARTARPAAASAPPAP